RRERLASSGAVSGEERQHARDAANSARAALLAAQQELEANRARVDRTTVDNHPDVRNAAARVRDAYLTYSRTALPAPVAGFGAGTGSAFALLPAQNATGNWIKIVQRVPVRIAFDAQELAFHPLQIGLSMQVEVDTHERKGDRLPLVQSAPTYATDVFHS